MTLVTSADALALDDRVLAHDLEHAALLRDPSLRAAQLAHERARVAQVLAAGGYASASARGLALVRPLPWDSQHFGWPSADLCRLYLDPEATLAEARELLEPALAEARRRGLRFLSARLLSSQSAALACLLESGLPFRLVDTSLELGARLPLELAGAGATVREARAGDLPRAFEAVASFVANRFHRDERIPRERAAAVYRSWLEAALRGEHGRLLVCEHEGEVAGCVTWAPADGLGVGLLGLLAVHPAHRGRGVLAALVAGCAARVGSTARALVTSTQVGNLAAQRGFARAGLLPVGARHILHALD
jgi:dTDP-4-amino-4,6-dideoxy-D-galactose acyltransferase